MCVFVCVCVSLCTRLSIRSLRVPNIADSQEDHEEAISALQHSASVQLQEIQNLEGKWSIFLTANVLNVPQIRQSWS